MRGWFKALGDLLVAGVGLCALVRIWQAFPLTASDPWPLLARMVLAVVIGVRVIGLIVQAAQFARALIDRRTT